jgi:hypothetical protein
MMRHLPPPLELSQLEQSVEATLTVSVQPLLTYCGPDKTDRQRSQADAGYRRCMTFNTWTNLPAPDYQDIG